eukprot:5519787-Pyramimonas_sp.AAC.1
MDPIVGAMDVRRPRQSRGRAREYAPCARPSGDGKGAQGVRRVMERLEGDGKGAQGVRRVMERLEGDGKGAQGVQRVMERSEGAHEVVSEGKVSVSHLDHLRRRLPHTRVVAEGVFDHHGPLALDADGDHWRVVLFELRQEH